MKLWQKLVLGGSLALAGAAGVFASIAFSAGQQASPSTTVTVTLTGGPTGPAGATGPPGVRGPAGPTGPPGATDCPPGATFGELRLNHPGGHVSILTCLVNG